ncbi:helix-turn-helix domain-containing protein [Nonomuraea sp. FMUSA5-5]|uniref:Helix-turn-helix domain-containing protein n=1 Tax=Nonomuraea composti TaxID=2720023 RepID=A0ABX1B6M3_9ACTN|nr:helix-turn-helix domain-containing protein [Nonomuraea sp. FMUSA5-5]NJP91411.1 helix-turn-helix domain-containing protein [Nonomuraea sp. FMUSA5-5]
MIVHDNFPKTCHPRAQRSEDWLTSAELACLARVSLSTVRRWARNGIGPRPHRVGPRLVRYHRPDVETWLTGTSKKGEGA